MMDNKESDGGEDKEKAGSKDERFFIEGSSSSEGELGPRFDRRTPRRNPQACRDSSPPLVLAFSLSTGRDLSPASSSESGQEQEEHIEEWMILGGEEQEGDTNIQLNLGCWSSSSEEDSGHEDQKPKTVDHLWAVSEKDKWGGAVGIPHRYYTADHSLNCHNCNKRGHLAKSCPTPKRRPTCVLCGVQGHIQRDCPTRHCPSCGLPPHSLRPCPEPPVWNQHCQRCGLTGHLSDACPDTWRQYHLTVRLAAPFRPQAGHALKHAKRPAHCYNCSQRGHYGHECARRRMVSGTFPSLPFVCRYDTEEDVLRRLTRMQRRARELRSAGSMPLSEHQPLSEPMGESGEENQGRRRSRDGRRKTWPERRRERREVKRLRREAQARQEGGGPGRTKGRSDHEAYPADLRSPRQATPPPQKKTRNEEKTDGRNRKSREAERWKKRGGVKTWGSVPTW